ncbi:MAG: hypothetical protein FD147_1725 [Chloroflexi bacterium]|nr:MAG: hypothetical protein FD147_1725 [Chloroflexota bacterium]
MSKSRKIPAKIIILVIVTLCLVGLFVESQTKLIQRTYDNFILDNRGHYLPCDKLPNETEVLEIVQRYQDIVQAIERVNPGHVGVEIDTSICPGKADLIIWYASHQNRLAIEAIIGDITFFGVPYRLQNR